MMCTPMTMCTPMWAPCSAGPWQGVAASMEEKQRKAKGRQIKQTSGRGGEMMTGGRKDEEVGGGSAVAPAPRVQCRAGFRVAPAASARAPRGGRAGPAATTNGHRPALTLLLTSTAGTHPISGGAAEGGGGGLRAWATPPPPRHPAPRGFSGEAPLRPQPPPAGGDPVPHPRSGGVRSTSHTLPAPCVPEGWLRGGMLGFGVCVLCSPPSPFYYLNGYVSLLGRKPKIFL